MMTEDEVLEKLASYKDAIIRIKNERDSAKQKAEELQLKIDSQNETYMQDSKEAWEKADHWEKSYNDLKEKSYHTIKHLVEDNIEVKEKEIEELKKNTESSQALLKDKDYLINQLQSNFNVRLFNENDEKLLANIQSQLQNAEAEKEKLQRQIIELQQQNQQTLQDEASARNAFLTELDRVMQEAGAVLQD